ncbi:MAG: imidazoleglycerol-phosphate dehydratase HisB [Spartobacteria bacterium]|nr:imidazoleglycerol-phosphate dehydratase HisB [Spartobacteria bacterium]
MTNRIVKKARKTRETDIKLELNLDGSGTCTISTGVGFFDHMLECFGKHALFDLTVHCEGDLQVDDHHTVEDVGIVLGDALNEALGDRAGINRYGWCLLPMDESLSRVAVDLGGRPYLVYQIKHPDTHINMFNVGLIEEFWRAVSTQARMNLHIAELYGKDVHHVYESVFKGAARALQHACALNERVIGVPSSKGVL